MNDFEISRRVRPPGGEVDDCDHERARRCADPAVPATAVVTVRRPSILGKRRP